MSKRPSKTKRGESQTSAHRQSHPGQEAIEQGGPGSDGRPSTARPNHSILDLQRTIGNQAVLRRMMAQSEGSEAAPTGSSVLGNYLPLQGSFASLAGTKVQPVAGLASNHQAMAQARDGAIEMDAAMVGAPKGDVQSLLAHETVHLAQQQGKGSPASTQLLETEASHLSANVLAGKPAWPALSGSSATPLKQPPGKAKAPTAEELREIDEAYKAATRPRRIKLDHLIAQFDYLQQLRTLIKERQTLETKRLILDSVNFGNVIQAGVEGGGIDMVNRKPLKIHVMPPLEGLPGELEITARFQVRFIGRTEKDARPDFQKLRNTLEAGMKQVWGQSLGGMPSLVRNYNFTVTPTVEFVAESAPRDPNFWLIQVDPTIKRAFTQALINDGMMSIGPNALDNADTLGHESLHLFGLIDRYRDNLATGHSESIRGTNTGGAGTGARRNDPLDTGKGPILPEDLEFVFAHSEVYDKVIMENLPPYDVALLNHLGRGDVPLVPDLLAKADAEAERAQKAAPPAPAGKAAQRTITDQTDPSKIVVNMIDDLIMKMTVKIDDEKFNSRVLDLPDMAPPPATKTTKP
jgi:hypothetical protein